MSFNEYLTQSMESFYNQRLNEGGAISKKIAEILGLKDMSKDEAVKKIVDFIMNAKESELEKITQGLEALQKVSTVAEGTDLNEGGILDFILKIDSRLKAIILAALVIAPNVLASPKIVHDIKVGKDEKVLTTQGPKALMNYLKDKKDQLEHETGATTKTVKEKLQAFVNDLIDSTGAKTKELGVEIGKKAEELGAKAGEKAKEMGSAGKEKAQEMGAEAKEKAKSFMGKAEDYLKKQTPTPKPETKTSQPPVGLNI